MTKITQTDRDLFITLTQQDDYTSDNINLGLQFTGEIKLIVLYRENAELKERAKIVEYLEKAANRGHDILQGIAMIKDVEHLK